MVGARRCPPPQPNLRFWIQQTIAVIISSSLLIFVVVWGLCVRTSGMLGRWLERKRRGTQPREWDDPLRWKDELLTKDPRYYARSCGFDLETCDVETEDGFILRVHRVVDPERGENARTGFPVLIMHGLFQSSGSFITSEHRSMAFWLARHGGYQVYLGNNRGVFDGGHREYSRYDPRFWAYDVRDLAQYDLPAMIDFVRQDTGYDRIAYIGHSQGSTIAFLALSRFMLPDLGRKLTYVAALAPAVYSGPLTKTLMFRVMRRMPWHVWEWVFGWLDYVPLMKFSYDWTPAVPYAALGYQMFAYLFEWTDTHWLPRRKPKMFRFTPHPISSAGMYWWAGPEGFCASGCIFAIHDKPWFDERFPPLSLYCGEQDQIVLFQPFLERIAKHEPSLRVIRTQVQPDAEHCDHYWAADAVEWCFYDIFGTYTRTCAR